MGNGQLKKELAFNSDLDSQLLFASVQKYDRIEIEMLGSCVENFNHGV